MVEDLFQSRTGVITLCQVVRDFLVVVTLVHVAQVVFCLHVALALGKGHVALKRALEHVVLDVFPFTDTHPEATITHGREVDPAGERLLVHELDTRNCYLLGFGAQTCPRDAVQGQDIGVDQVAAVGVLGQLEDFQPRTAAVFALHELALRGVYRVDSFLPTIALSLGRLLLNEALHLRVTLGIFLGCSGQRRVDIVVVSQLGKHIEGIVPLGESRHELHPFVLDDACLLKALVAVDRHVVDQLIDDRYVLEAIPHPPGNVVGGKERQHGSLGLRRQAITQSAQQVHRPLISTGTKEHITHAVAQLMGVLALYKLLTESIVAPPQQPSLTHGPLELGLIDLDDARFLGFRAGFRSSANRRLWWLRRFRRLTSATCLGGGLGFNCDLRLGCRSRRDFRSRSRRRSSLRDGLTRPDGVKDRTNSGSELALCKPAGDSGNGSDELVLRLFTNILPRGRRLAFYLCAQHGPDARCLRSGPSHGVRVIFFSCRGLQRRRFASCHFI